VTVAARPWNDPAARFDGFDAVVFRSNWDYHHALEAFVEWLDRWQRAGVRFWNPPELIRWNLTKRYLLDLDRAGVGIVPTVILDGEGPTPLAALLDERGWATAVVKPVVSASAHDTVLVPPGAAPAVARAIDDGEIRRPVMVQPFIEDIRTRGEWSLVFIDGRLTHSALKRPDPGDFRVQARYGGSTVAAPAPAQVVAAGERALAALPVAPLYARVDGIETADGFLVMEVELHEPGLFFGLAPPAAEAFADAIIRRV
jgi:glutathione synthase/RimK-type ligase-like ATP-grasp enzyme